jgi:hypothetical protein
LIRLRSCTGPKSNRRTQPTVVSEPSQPTPVSFIITVTERELKEGEREHLRGTQIKPPDPTNSRFRTQSTDAGEFHRQREGERASEMERERAPEMERERERESAREGERASYLNLRERNRRSKILNRGERKDMLSLVHFKISVPHRQMKMLATLTNMGKMWRFACTEAFLFNYSTTDIPCGMWYPVTLSPNSATNRSRQSTTNENPTTKP